MPISGSHNGAYEVNKSYKTGRTCLVENSVFLSCKETVLDMLKYRKSIIRGRRNAVLYSTKASQLQTLVFEELIRRTHVSSPLSAVESGKNHIQVDSQQHDAQAL